jgi:hypothetical protein
MGYYGIEWGRDDPTTLSLIPCSFICLMSQALLFGLTAGPLKEDSSALMMTNVTGRDKTSNRRLKNKKKHCI